LVKMGFVYVCEIHYNLVLIILSIRKFANFSGIFSSRFVKMAGKAALDFSPMLR
jgi:hypothetical protein